MTVTIHWWLKATTTKVSLHTVEVGTRLQIDVVSKLRGIVKVKMKNDVRRTWRLKLQRWIDGVWENVWSEAKRKRC